jgi:hypothetical protein
MGIRQKEIEEMPRPSNAVPMVGKAPKKAFPVSILPHIENCDAKLIATVMQYATIGTPAHNAILNHGLPRN